MLATFRRQHLPALVEVAVVLVFVLCLPLLRVSHQGIALLILVFVYATVTHGLTLLYGTGGLLSIAQGGLWGVGAYTCAIGAVKNGWPFIPTVLLAIVVTTVLSTLVALLSLRVRGHYFVIITFAVAEGIRALINAWTDVTGGTQGITVAVPATVGDLKISQNIQWYYIAGITLVIVLVAMHFTSTSAYGRRLAASRDNVQLASSVGINVARSRIIAFAISGALAGLGGVYWAYSQSYVQGDQFGASASITFILVMLLGGSRYLLGPTIGAAVVVFLPIWLNLPPLLSSIVLGAVFIVVIMLAPSGIAGLGDVAIRLFRRWRNNEGVSG